MTPQGLADIIAISCPVVALLLLSVREIWDYVRRRC